MNGADSFFSREECREENKEKNQEVRSKEKEGREIKMLTWNVAGLTEMKREKIEYIKGFDIIGLVETWITKEKKDKIQKILEEYNLETVEARKENIKGRAKGGILLGIRKGLAEAQKTIKETEEVLAIEVVIKRVKTRIIITYMNENKERNWKDIKEVIEEDERIGTIIGGDFNARIGEEGG